MCLAQKCDKWPRNGKQHELGWVALASVLKNDQWSLGCMHVFCKTTPLVGCFTKHECEDDEFKGNIYMLEDLLGCKTWKIKMSITNDLFLLMHLPKTSSTM